MSKSSETIKLTTVRVSSHKPGDEAPLGEYSIDIGKDLPYFHALYGNRTAYMALGEILRLAQAENQFFASASMTLEVSGFKRVGVLHGEDLESDLRGVINLSRVSKDVAHMVAELYQKDRQDHPELEKLSNSDWRKPFRYMPDQIHLLPQVFDLFGCEVLVHPVRLPSTPFGSHHFIASVRLDKAKVVAVEPNLFEPGPHPKLIKF